MTILLAAPVVLELGYLLWIWPNWEALANGPIPQSKFMKDYLEKQQQDAKLPTLRWSAVPLKEVPQHLLRAFVVAEDYRFYDHHGFDFEAIKEAMDRNMERHKVTHGASTISQQTVKNLFLSPSRSWLRKWHEAILTWAIERNLSKEQILELYVNVVELGTGIYGIRAAAFAYWGVAPARVSLEQSIELAVSLPSPKKHNPISRTRIFLQKKNRLMEKLDAIGQNQATAEALGKLQEEQDAPPSVVEDTKAREKAPVPLQPESQDEESEIDGEESW